jgi:hypothetical protein
VCVSPVEHAHTFSRYENVGMLSVPVKLYYKQKSQTTYVLYDTYLTDATGKYNITTSLSTNLYDFIKIQ